MCKSLWRVSSSAIFLGCGDNYPSSSWSRNAQCGRMRWWLYNGHSPKCSSVAGGTSNRPDFSIMFIVQMFFFLQHTLIDANNKSGSLEFSVGGNPDDFFPVTLGFNSTKSFSGIKVTSDIFLMETIMIKSFLRFLTVWRWTGGAQWNIQQTRHSLQRNMKLFKAG